MNSPLPPGTTLKHGKYRVHDLLKIGGQSIVYVGVAVEPGGQVIVKQNYEDQEWSREVLRQEWELLAGLRHRSLPQALDCFDERGSTFLVLSYILGTDVEELLKRHKSPVPYHDALEWAYQLLDILEYLQAQTPVVVHRDINPKNIRLTPDGQIFLLDFGIAKRIDLKTFLVGGTRRYTPPEQLKGEGTDARTDIYAFAATIYYILTAREPLDSLSRESAVLKGEPDPLRPAHELNGEIPKPISQVLGRALSLDRQRRPADSLIMRRLISDAVQGIYEEEETTQASTAAETNPDVTRVSVKDSIRVVVPLEGAERGNATQEASRLVELLDAGYSLNPSIIQLLIEVIDSPPNRRGEVLAHHSALLSKNHEPRAQVGITLIRKLEANANLEARVEKQLRQRLGRLLADHTLSEIKAGSDKQDVPETRSDEFLVDAKTIQQHVTHQRWLKSVAIWVVRGFLAGVAAQLLLSLFTGGRTVAELISEGGGGVWIAHLLVMSLGFLLGHFIRRRKYGNRQGYETLDLPWLLASSGFGLLLSMVVFHDILWVFGATD